MPSTWIKRDIEAIFAPVAPQLQLFPVWLLLGPRQVGKSSLLKRCASSNRQYINLDDLQVRERATRDPVLFLKELKVPFIIDEIQYAPQLLSGIKMLADSGVSPGSIWLTGSQSFEVMSGVQESLAGRVGILNLLGLSDHEKSVSIGPPEEYFRSLIETTFPKLAGVTDPASRALYLNSYVQTYIERDVVELLGIEKRRQFEIFVKMVALRTGQIVNYDDLARDVGVSAVTIKEWLGVLESSFIVRLVHPYHSNKTKRLIKSPKVYFLDMGLAAHLSGWRDAEMLRLGPMGGAAFETHIFGQILRRFQNLAHEVQVHFWRTRDGEEIDFLVETKGQIFPIEVKLGNPDVRSLPHLEKISETNWKAGSVISLSAGDSPIALNAHWHLQGPTLENLFL
jgi:uncharacterized protein